MSNLSNETIKRLALYVGFTTKEGGDLRSYVYEFARAIENTAIARMKQENDGWQLVPIEPTEEMLRSAQRARQKDQADKSSTAYKAMLAAAPSPASCRP